MVYDKRPFAGPEQLIDYLRRYTHRTAISNDRLIALEDGGVRFRWRDYAEGDPWKEMVLTGEEFIRRFLLHILPLRFIRIRRYGILANRGRAAKLAHCRRLLQAPEPEPVVPETVEALWLRVAGLDIHRCPHCHTGRLRIVLTLCPEPRGLDPLGPSS